MTCARRAALVQMLGRAVQGRYSLREPQDEKMRAVIYARYSSDLQRDASIEDQVRVCRRRIDAEGWTPGRVYSDHGASGASHLRAGYQALLQDARSQKFDVVVAESLD